MVTQNVQEFPYRIEERFTGGGGDEFVMSVSTWDGVPLTADTAWDLIQRSRRQYPGRYDTYRGSDDTPLPGQRSLFRLVLIGPDHVAPERVVEGPAR